MVSEDFGTVFDFGSGGTEYALHLLGGVRIRKQCHHMHLLGGFDLHSGNNQKLPLCRSHCGADIGTGIVVGQGDDVKTFNHRHINDVIRSHVIVAAGGEGGVYM